MPQPPLSEMPGRGTGQVARSPEEAGAVARGVFPCGVHAAGTDSGDRLLLTKKTVYGILFPRHRGNPADHRPRSAAPGCGDRLLCRVAYVGTESAAPSASALRGARRRTFAGSRTLDLSCLPGFFLPVRVLSELFRRLFLEQLERRLLLSQRTPDSPAPSSRFTMPSPSKNCWRSHEARDWVVYAKPPFGGPQRALEIPGPLHPSDRHSQPPKLLSLEEEPGDVSVEGLSGANTARNPRS